jgi:replicative DNA helicase
MIHNHANDIISIATILDHQLDQIGGFGYLENLQDFFPNSPDKNTIKKWLVVLNNNFIAKSIESAATKIQEMARNGFSPDLIAKSSKILVDAISTEALGISTLDQVLLSEINRREENVAVKGLMPRSNTIARLSGPYISGDLVVIAGGAGIGKTFWILKDAIHQVINNGAHCLFVPLEMSSEALARRVLSQSFGMLPNEVREASVSIDKSEEAKAEVDNFKNFYISKNINRPAEIESMAKWIISQGAEKLVIIVDPAILADPNNPTGNATQDARSFWREMKMVTERLATEIDVCVTIIAHHITKEASRNKEQKRPSLEDLDTAGHQNVSLAIVVRKENADLVTAYCVKNRHDRADWEAPMVWRPTTLSFEDIAEFCPICALNGSAQEMSWNGRQWECRFHKSASA